MKPNKLKYPLLFASLFVYFVLNNWIGRDNFTILISGVLFLALGYFYFLKNNTFSVKEIVVFAILFRVILLFSPPNLSDDYFRFVLDGQLQVKKQNPYLFLPKTDDYNAKGKEVKFYLEIYDGLNSTDYYTVYPPMNQFVFGLSSYLSGKNLNKNILYLKLFIFLFEIGILFLLFKILKWIKRKENLAIIYAFNPLVIIELVGNIHFEGMMLFFLLFSFYFLHKNKLIIAGILFGLAVSTKLIPLILLPLLFRYIGLKRSIVFYSIVGMVNVILFLPYLSAELIGNFGSSIDLYFQTFEFNASFYYLFRKIGFWITGYNQIGIIGLISPILVLVFTFYISFKGLTIKNILRNNSGFEIVSFAKNAAIILFVYYLLASIIHPWYVINLVLLSVFFTNRIFLIWSITVFLSYFAYSNYMNIHFPNYTFQQSNWYYIVIFIEYISMVFFWIYFKKTKKTTLA